MVLSFSYYHVHALEITFDCDISKNSSSSEGHILFARFATLEKSGGGARSPSAPHVSYPSG